MVERRSATGARTRGMRHALALRGRTVAPQPRESPARGPEAESASGYQGDAHFETVLVELSTRFVNAFAEDVDRQGEGALRAVVEYLEIDRAAFGEVAADGSVVLTHFYVVPGVSTYPRTSVNGQMP